MLFNRTRRHARRSSPSVARRPVEGLENRLLFAAGDVDTSFGTGGVARADFGAPIAFGGDIVVDAGRGRVLVSGSRAPAGSTPLAALAAFKLDGTPDTTFSGDGKLVTDLRGGAGKLALLGDGRFYLAVSTPTANPGVSTQTVARFNRDGSYDRSFSGDGKVSLATAGTIAAAPGNKLVHVAVKDFNAVVTRFNADGSLDKTLGGDGSVTLDYLPGALEDGGYDWTDMYEVLVQPDGKTFLVGNVYGYDYWDGAVARLNVNGTYDNTFSGDGRLIVVSGGIDDFANAAALAPNGDLFVAITEGENDASVIRLAPNGNFKPFADPGMHNSDDNDILDVSVAPDGKVVATGQADWSFQDPSPPSNYFLYRLGASGGIDPGFGGTAAGRFVYSPGVEHALDASGNIYVLHTGGGFAVTRFRSSGGASAAGSQSLSAGQLTITATARDDEIRVSRSGTVITASVNGYARSYSASRISKFLINAGAGNDDVRIGAEVTLPATVNGSAGSDKIFTGGGNDLIDGGDNLVAYDEVLDGGAGNDTILGGNGDDDLRGGAGNDRLEGDAGFDNLDGGAGADDLLGGADSDWLSYTSRSGNLTVTLDNVANDGESGERDNARSDIEGVGGGAGNDRITGNSANNVFWGLGGNDTLVGAAGNDALRGGTGNDRVDGGDGNDEIAGEENDDVLVGGNGDDQLSDYSGADTFDSGPGNDTVNGVREDGLPTSGPIRYADAERAVFVEGSDVADVVRVSDVTTAGGRFVRVDSTRGGVTERVDFPFAIVSQIFINTYAGNDRVDLSGVAIPASVHGSDGDDNLTGGEAADKLDGGNGNDVLTGRAGNDTLFGGAGKDQLRGQGGDDLLDAKADGSADFLDGGSGTDQARKDDNDFAQFVEQFLA
jgi:uncharacterized delta-60 repeat protein